MQQLRVAGSAEVHPAGQREQRLACFVLKPAPPLPRGAGEPHVQVIGVGAAEDPGAAVRAAVLVPRAERLEHHHVEAACRRRPGGRRARQAGAHDDQVRACCHGRARLPFDIKIIIPNDWWRLSTVTPVAQGA
jgi:hypothetical protein